MNIFSEKIPVEKQEAIKNFILENFGASLSAKEYAFWQVKNADFSAVFYHSSKFVVQGKNIAPLMEKLSGEFSDINHLPQQAPTALVSYNLPYIGTDESGKGDFFGPLVVAGVLVNEKNRQVLADLGVKDSKTLKDGQILKLAQQIRKISEFSVVAVSNKKYNELYRDFKNLNKLLAWGHARVIENILDKNDCQYALSDKFGDENLIKNALMKKGKTIKLDQRVRAESDIAVAAASIIARAVFVEKMKQMENFYGLEFPKGCGSQVKTSAKKFIEKYGQERLEEICKSHFKTYKEILN